MFESVSSSRTGINDAVGHLLAVTHSSDSWSALSPAELMATLEQLQQAANLVTAAEQSLLAHAIAEDTFEAFGHTTTTAMLVDRLHLNPTDARVRAHRAKQTPPRTTLTGEALPPKHEVLAEARAAGSLTGAHVDAVTIWLTRIEPHASLTQYAEFEQRLVDKACKANPDAVATVGREILTDLNPDGPEPRDPEKRRAFSFRQATDGFGRLTATLLPEDLAKLEALLSPLAAPRPENPQTGERDTRGVTVRRYDAFVELLDRLLQSGDLPAHGGIPFTVVVLMELDDLLAKTGTARTTFGTTIPVKRLLEQAAEMQVVPVITSKVDGVIAYGVNRRIASPGQALALIARDRGCTFPGCCRPAQWTQRHHIREVVADNGLTDLDNLTLVCGWHHRHFSRLGWTVQLRGDRAWWTPPPTVDPDRQPLLNHMHHPAT